MTMMKALKAKLKEWTSLQENLGIQRQSVLTQLEALDGIQEHRALHGEETPLSFIELLMHTEGSYVFFIINRATSTYIYIYYMQSSVSTRAKQNHTKCGLMYFSASIYGTDFTL